MKPRRLSALSSALLTATIAASSLILGAAPAYADATIVSDLVNDPGVVSEASKCEADVAIVGVRGSDQPLVESHEGKPVQEGSRPEDQIAGFGNEVATAAYEITRRLPAETNVRLIPVTYPAPHWLNGIGEVIEAPMFGPLLGPDVIDVEVLAIGKNDTYMASVKQGVDNLRNTVSTLVSTCPDTRIVLIGFSQGAHVVHLSLDPMRHDGLLDSIDAVQLIADPVRDPEDKVPYYYNGQGTLGDWTPMKFGFPVSLSTWYPKEPSRIQEGTSLGGMGSLRFMPDNYLHMPPEVAGKTVHVCHALDHVCNARWGVDLGVHGTVYQNRFSSGFVATEGRQPGVGTHINNSDIYTVPGDWVTKKLNLSQRTSSSGGVFDSAECKAVTVIGARGEDWLEAPDAARSSGPGIEGFGPAVSAAAQKLSNKLGDSVAFAPLKPQAPPFEGMHGFMGPPNMYDLQVQADVERAQALAGETVLQCPRTKIVMVGYSQGAQVLHEAVAKSDQMVQNRIAAIWLMGDTARNPSAVTNFVGAGENPPANDSGGQYAAEAQARGATVLPLGLKDRIYSVCMLEDKGCRNPNESENGPTDRQTQRGIYLDPGTVEAGAEWVLKRVASLPVFTMAQIKEQIGDDVGMAHEWWKRQGTGYNIRRPV